ncbi:hypothetical protein BDW02DRAFT_570808 [Decorospora gaudefroyi]|uniref:DUF4211 domain-containing protein n=1 Tax=Decorospora gaudefroyi TaxID=184978 RepID=A0A6A5KCC1_9PLEO|nr:hypothetical protein BDW02DRAFT_570808 [Decorospora gaudefroyi]
MAPKKSVNRKRQTKLNFSPTSQSSPATRSTVATAMVNSPSKPTLTPSKPNRRAPNRISNSIAADMSSEDEFTMKTERAMRLGMPSGSRAHGMLNGSDSDSAISESSESSEDEDDRRRVKITSTSRKRRRATLPSESESESEEPTVKVIPRKRQRRVVEIDISEDETSKRDRKRRRRNERSPDEIQVRTTSRSTRRGGARKAPVTDDEDDELCTPARSSRRRIVLRGSPSEEEEQSPPRSRRRRGDKRRSPSDEEEEAQTSPEPSRRETRGEPVSDEEYTDKEAGSGNKHEGEEEQDELKEDLAFLRSSPLLDRGRLRSTHEKPKNKRQEALEALKRRRAGTNEPSSSATSGRRKLVVIDSESDSELEVIKEEPDSDADMSEEEDMEDDEEESDRDANAFDMFQENHEDENFIDDDVDNTIGQPSANEDLDEMRLAFSLSRAKTKDLFKNAVEWMVMKKIHPGFDSTKHVYTVTFRKLDDEVKGLAGSKYTSAAWTPDFTRAIRARPDLVVNDIAANERRIMTAHCEACNRSNHPASAELMFSGPPYHPETLEPLANDSDSDSNSDSNSNSDSESDTSSSSGLSSSSEALLNGEKPTYNFQQERIPPESHRFPLGSTCRANAQVAHTLYHWRYHLYQWVKDYLRVEGHLTAEELVKRDRWSDRKREKAARKIVGGMDENGQIKKLYHSYKDQVKAAMEADNEYRRGWGRRG